MKLSTRTQEVDIEGRPHFEALDILVSHNGKVAVWRTTPHDPAFVHKIIETMNRMVQSLSKDFPELIDKLPAENENKVNGTGNKNSDKETRKGGPAGIRAPRASKQEGKKEPVTPVVPSKRPKKKAGA